MPLLGPFMIFTCVLQEVKLRQGNFKSHTSKYPDNYLVGHIFLSLRTGTW